jgi:hypothetical protein
MEPVSKAILKPVLATQLNELVKSPRKEEEEAE